MWEKHQQDCDTQQMCIVSKLLLYEAPMRMEPIGCRGQRIIHDDALTDRQHALKCVAE